MFSRMVGLLRDLIWWSVFDDDDDCDDDEGAFSDLVVGCMVVFVELQLLLFSFAISIT